MIAQTSHLSVSGSRQDFFTTGHQSVLLTFVGTHYSWCDKQAILQKIFTEELNQKC